MSDDGTVYSFGSNYFGELGDKNTSFETQVSPPRVIQNLPTIVQVFCGFKFTICLDEHGFMWAFGLNDYGQLGILQKDTETSISTPHRITGIPPVKNISCGLEHTLVITNDDNLWSFGNNSFGQLCTGNKISHTKPKQTSFSNVSNISASGVFSLFQSNNQVYGCGYNYFGQLGLDHNKNQKMPCVIPDQPPNIVQISCGYHHSFLLDDQGNVFSTGKNNSGQLGIDTKDKLKLKLSQISNIPPIDTILCVADSSYLIDFEGNVWSFGDNLLVGHTRTQ